MVPGPKFSMNTSAFWIELAQEFAATRILQVAGDAALVGVEQQKVKGIHANPLGRGAASLIAALWLLHFDHVRAKPRQRLGARGPGFELCQVNDAHTGQGRAASGLGRLHDGQCTSARARRDR